MDFITNERDNRKLTDDVTLALESVDYQLVKKKADNIAEMSSETLMKHADVTVTYDNSYPYIDVQFDSEIAHDLFYYFAKSYALNHDELARIVLKRFREHIDKAIESGDVEIKERD